MLVCIRSDDDVALFRASLAALCEVVDGIVVLDTTPEALRTHCDVEATLKEYFGSAADARYHYSWEQFKISKDGFGEARNYLLEKTPINAYALWVDTDEVHFSEQLALLKKEVLDSEKYDDISINFVHFCIGSNLFEYIEPKVRIFKNTPGLKWEGRSHEHLVFEQMAPRKVFYSDYQFHHYGYLRSQDLIAERWDLYAYLEGKKYEKAVAVAEKQTIEFIAEGKTAKRDILSSRLVRLMPYLGDYPSAIPISWLESKHFATK